jgi:hypothetical protein
LAGALRGHLARIVAILVVCGLWAATRLPVLADEERRALAERFAFSAFPLEAWPGPYQTRRKVNPVMERHAGWMSAVGAAVALADLDGDGLANDVCQVDPRSDRVTLAPAPGTGERYAIVALDPGPSYDRATMAPMGCVPADLNEDGRMDLFVYYWGRTPILFLSLLGSGSAPSRAGYLAQELVPGGERWFTNAATFADLDADGHLDLVVGNYFADGARILDASASVPDFMQHSMSRAYNGGRNRIFRWRHASAGSQPQVSFEQVDGLFEDDVLHAWTLAVGAADLDGDLRPELYFANDFGPDRLFHNRSSPGQLRFALLEGRRHLTTPRSKVLGGDSFKGMGVDFADVNGDGWLDFFVSNIAAEYALLESHFLFVSTGDLASMHEGVAPYDDLSEWLGVARSSWAWDTRFGDFDNDGVPEALQATGFAKGDTDRWPELQELATTNDELLRFAGSWPRFREGDDISGHEPNPFYVLAADGRYYDLAAELGLDAPHVSRGIATADVDGDGDLDFAVANQWETSFFYRNDRSDGDRDAGRKADFLGLRLLLPVAQGDGRAQGGHSGNRAAGRPAVGASVRVVRADGRVLVAQVDGGNGHSGVRSPELHFGLGAEGAGKPVDVEIRYRDRNGRPRSLALTLAPGWHRILLPDEPASLVMATGVER